MLLKTFILSSVAMAVMSATPSLRLQTSKTIVDLAVSTPDLSTLVTALTAGGLVKTLSAKGPFTVFAPTNEAFDKVPAAELARLLDPANLKDLDALLTYHVASGSVFAKDITNGEKIKTVEGQSVTAQIFMGNRIFINNAEVTTADIAASNGVVHIIDTVLSLPVPPPSTKNIVELAIATPNLSTLVTALKAGNLVATLEGTGPFTVFAPTDEAFAKLPSLYRQLLLDPKNVKTLQKVLTYHVSAGAVLSKDIVDKEVIRTVEGQDVIAHVTKAHDDHIMINDAYVTTADVVASNGVIHIVDSVLMPPDMLAIGNLTAATPGLTTLATALKAAELVDTLNTAGPFTVFAPTDEAFAALPKASLAYLLEPSNIDSLQQLLKYHVVAGSVKSTALTNGESVKTLEGKAVSVTVSATGIKINSATVTTADVLALNGVVHIIDEVLMPSDLEIPTKDIVGLAVATSDLSTLVTALKAGALVATLQGAGPFTVFAPTNEAFAKLSPIFLKLLLDPSNVKTLQKLLTYHVVAGAIYSNALTNNESIITVEGEKVVAHVVPSGGFEEVCTRCDCTGRFNIDYTFLGHFDGADKGFIAVEANRACKTKTFVYQPGTGAVWCRLKDECDTGGQPISGDKQVYRARTTVGIKINDAAVTTADVRALNGVVHIIDSVLMPSGMPHLTHGNYTSL